MKTYPITIGPANAVAMTGLSWRYVRDLARARGVPIWKLGSKSVIPAAPLLAALERVAAERRPGPEKTDEQALADLRRELGLELRPEKTDEQALADLRRKYGLELKR